MRFFLITIFTFSLSNNAFAFFDFLYKQEEISICNNAQIHFDKNKYYASFIKNKDFNIDIKALNYPKKLNSRVYIFNICAEKKENELAYLNCLGEAKGLPNINRFDYLYGKTLNINKVIKQTNKITNKSNYYIISYSSPNNMILNNRYNIYEMIVIKYSHLVKLMPKLKQDLNQNKLFCNKKDK
jgi:hypothetical protein